VVEVWARVRDASTLKRDVKTPRLEDFPRCASRFPCYLVVVESVVNHFLLSLTRQHHTTLLLCAAIHIGRLFTIRPSQSLTKASLLQRTRFASLVSGHIALAKRSHHQNLPSASIQPRSLLSQRVHFRTMGSSSAPPIVSSKAPINPQYDLGELPTVAGADPERNVLDAAKLIVAKQVSEAWGLDVAKVFAGVDTGQLGSTSPFRS